MFKGQGKEQLSINYFIQEKWVIISCISKFNIINYKI